MNSTLIFPNPSNPKEKILASKQESMLFPKKLLNSRKVQESTSKELRYAETTQKLFKYLRSHHLIQDVTIKSNQLKFRVRENDFAFNLLKAFFNSAKLEGVVVEVKKAEREYFVTVFSDDLENIIAHFKRLLGMVYQELKFRKLLKIQLKFDKLISVLANRFRPKLA